MLKKTVVAIMKCSVSKEVDKCFFPDALIMK